MHDTGTTCPFDSHKFLCLVMQLCDLCSIVLCDARAVTTHSTVPYHDIYYSFESKFSPDETELADPGQVPAPYGRKDGGSSTAKAAAKERRTTLLRGLGSLMITEARRGVVVLRVISACCVSLQL